MNWQHCCTLHPLRLLWIGEKKVLTVSNKLWKEVNFSCQEDSCCQGSEKENHFIYKRHTSQSSNIKALKKHATHLLLLLKNWSNTESTSKTSCYSIQAHLEWISNKPTGGTSFYVGWMRGTMLVDNNPPPSLNQQLTLVWACYQVSDGSRRHGSRRTGG